LTKPIRRDELRKAIGSVLGFATNGETQEGSQLITRYSIAEAASFRLLKMDSKEISETKDQVKNRMEEMSAIFK